MHSRSIKSPTKAERTRLAKIVEHGCCACLTYMEESLHPVEVHHLLDGGVRRGHEFTIALCQFHHRGVPPYPIKSQKEATELLGPSLALDGKAFRSVYGDDKTLLEFQESILRQRS